MSDDESRGTFTDTFTGDIKNSIKYKIHSKTTRITTPVHHAEYNASHPGRVIKNKIESKVYQKFGGGVIGNAFSHATNAKIEKEFQ